jgi:peptidoglycan hydrolase CwlO-like protein
MNKKIISLFLLLILMVSITATYVYFNQNQNNETQYDSSDKTVGDADIANEIDDMFLEEDDEVEIGDII